MYNIQGLKRNGTEVNKNYTDIKIARFEFECMQLNNISQYLVLYDTTDGMEQIDIFIN